MSALPLKLLHMAKKLIDLDGLSKALEELKKALPNSNNATKEWRFVAMDLFKPDKGAQLNSINAEAFTDLSVGDVVHVENGDTGSIHSGLVVSKGETDFFCTVLLCSDDGFAYIGKSPFYILRIYDDFNFDIDCYGNRKLILETEIWEATGQDQRHAFSLSDESVCRFYSDVRAGDTVVFKKYDGNRTDNKVINLTVASVDSSSKYEKFWCIYAADSNVYIVCIDTKDSSFYIDKIFPSEVSSVDVDGINSQLQEHSSKIGSLENAAPIIYTALGLNVTIKGGSILSSWGSVKEGDIIHVVDEQDYVQAGFVVQNVSRDTLQKQLAIVDFLNKYIYTLKAPLLRPTSIAVTKTSL